MYAIYRRTPTALGGHYVFDHETAFFGVRSGMIPQLLREQTSLAVGEPVPVPWHLDIARLLGKNGQAFLINLKPNNKDENTSRSLYELLDVWGYSWSGWTPAMLRLRGLVVDGDPPIDDSEDFDVVYRPEHQTIYSFLYMAGSIQDGHLVGKWTAPRASPTNSALLWPDAFRYFVRQVAEVTPEVLGSITI